MTPQVTTDARHRLLIVLMAFWATSCGGDDSSTPTSPSRPTTTSRPLPAFQLSASPNPVQAEVVTSTTQSTTYRVGVTVTLRESANSAGRITRLRSTVVRSIGAETSGTLDVD